MSWASLFALLVEVNLELVEVNMVGVAPGSSALQSRGASFPTSAVGMGGQGQDELPLKAVTCHLDHVCVPGVPGNGAEGSVYFILSRETGKTFQKGMFSPRC